jgi:hypothetical protein
MTYKEVIRLSEYTTFGLGLATFLIVLAGAVYGVIRWIKKKKEEDEYKKLIEDPLEVYFRIPPKSLHLIKYEKQDDEDHTKNELVLPPNSEDYLFLLIRPKLNLYSSDRYFGFGPHDGRIPELSYCELFYVESSGLSPRWGLDIYGCIHFETEKWFFKDETYLPSFQIVTHDKGNYLLEIDFNFRSTEYKNVKKEIGKHIVKHLTLRVE